MTVEQNVLQQSAAQKHQQTFLNQLREITGINDTQILQQALKRHPDESHQVDIHIGKMK